MLDISPHIEQAIVSQAEQQGLTVNQFLSNIVYQEPYLDTDIMTFKFVPTAEQAKQLQELLDNPAPVSPAMQRLMNCYKELDNVEI